MPSNIIPLYTSTWVFALIVENIRNDPQTAEIIAYHERDCVIDVRRKDGSVVYCFMKKPSGTIHLLYAPDDNSNFTASMSRTEEGRVYGKSMLMRNTKVLEDYLPNLDHLG